ncbi:hypothetical protein GCM10007920_18240 [Ciceribacter naphthalenivorans]|uniref:Uncharacterized protein n=2 Tax=Alphaproteobacteria TaxID=28211 RepID=A0A512HJH3_9HYPH|nr:hypothetical protein RNA01_25400 [Ciceribacter naphthalenivorans]GLR22037.1 hypothetical protein GCM10007920_18240 [Ciceribacter naphthalenivorans]GLT04893.1 hypothetical protein GCM10007926_18240 [Sphingomonas psychrolutea]
MTAPKARHCGIPTALPADLLSVAVGANRVTQSAAQGDLGKAHDRSNKRAGGLHFGEMP